MKYEALIQHAKYSPCFSPSLLTSLGTSSRNAENQLIRWQKVGRVIRLKRGLYTLPEDKRKIPLSLRWLANRLYSPSYISLESMLSFYEMIPEQITALTSIATAKTASFVNPLGNFTYASIKKDRFFGFKEIADENGVLVRVATPEKALLDKIYFDKSWRNERSYFEVNLRLQNLNLLKPRLLRKYTKQFDSKRIEQACRWILTLRKFL